MSRTIKCGEEFIIISNGEGDVGKLVGLANNGKFHPSVIPGIVDLQDQITKETTVRSEADRQLQDSIDVETNARTVADRDLQDQITKEIAVRTDSDTTLQSNIDAEITARTDADSKLQISINAEADARTKADQGLQDQITAEIIARSEADKQLQANIDNAKIEANSYTDTKVAGLINDAPGALDTLKELADALNNDSNFAATVTNQLAQKADKSQIPTSLPANGGNADTATRLATAHTINDVAFDGSVNITITAKANGGNADTATKATSADSATNATYAASAGNADTVDGKHASDFAPNGYGLGTRAISKNDTDLNSLLGAGCGFYCGYNMTNAPDTGWWYITHIDHVYTDGWAMQQAVAYGSMNTYSAGKVFVRVCMNNSWSSWN